MSKKNEIAKNEAVPGALALNDVEIDDMFGDSAPDESTPLSFNNYSIMRESAQFAIGEDDYAKTLTGHILYKHCAKQYYTTEFDPSNPSAPDCYSTNGIKPADNCEAVQCEGLCCSCKWSQYGTADKGEGKACKDTIRFLFMPEGSVLPVTIIAPPTSLSKKGPLQSWLNSVMNDVAKAFTAIGKTNRNGGPIVDYWWAKVELSLEKKTFDGGEASILKIKTLDVVTPETDEGIIAARAIHQARQSFKDVYINELTAHVEATDSEAPAAEAPVQTNETGGFNDEGLGDDQLI